LAASCPAACRILRRRSNDIGDSANDEANLDMNAERLRPTNCERL
jgi:hypothetical protein